MKKLTIENFLNEMSYNLSEYEMETVVLKYQDILIDYFINCQWLRNEKKTFHEACSKVREKLFLDTLYFLIESKPELVSSDMAFVVLSASKFRFVENDVKFHCADIAYKLRLAEYEEKNISPQLKTLLASLSGWIVVGCEMNNFVRVKCVETIIDRLPKALAIAFDGKLSPKTLSDKKIYGIITLLSDKITAQDIIKALLKSTFDYKKEDKAYGYACRIKSFLYSLIYLSNDRDFQDILRSVALSFDRFNNGETKMTFKDSYLDMGLLTAIVNSKELEKQKPKEYETFKKTYEAIARFKMENPKLSYLF